MFEIECLFGIQYCWCLIPTLGLSSSFSLSSHSQPFFLRGPHSCSTMMPVSPSWPGLQSHVSHLSHVSRVTLVRHVSRVPAPVAAPVDDAHALLPPEAGEAAVAGAPGLGGEGEAEQEEAARHGG